MKTLLKKLMAREKLSFDEIGYAVESIANKEASDAQIAAFLVAITSKGVDNDEFYAFAANMRKFANRVATDKYIVDSCGTGADLSGTINISTSASIVANACGVNVIKQTNSSITSVCGSTDFLSALGIGISRNPEVALNMFNTKGISFVHSPYFNEFARVNNPIRQQIGIKTIFNFLGPLINPSFPNAQLLGVSSEKMCDNMAYALQKLGTDRALVVNGLSPNLDEISICSKTRVLELRNSKVEEYFIVPEDFGFRRAELSEIQGGKGCDNAKIIYEIFENKRKDAMHNVILLNAGAMVYLASLANSIQEGICIARECIESGMALKVLEGLKNYEKKLISSI